MDRKSTVAMVATLAVMALLWVVIARNPAPTEDLLGAAPEQSGTGPSLAPLPGAGAASPTVVGAREIVKLMTPDGELEIVAKMDTGADVSSIDMNVARSLGLTAYGLYKDRVRTTRGVVTRNTVTFTYLLGGREIRSVVNLADRSDLSTPMIVGRADLAGFLVDGSREFVTSAARDIPLPRSTLLPSLLLPLFNVIGGPGLQEIIIMIPILASVVVLLRLIIGVHTFGVFAPTVIGVTLVDMDMLRGLTVYMSLVVAGISVKLILLKHLRLAHIAELGLVMFTLVVILAGLTLLPARPIVSFTALFFPLIVTSHLIEQASKSIEEHSLSEAFFLLASTLATSVALAFLGLFLVELPLPVLWMVFAGSMLATVGYGRYLGLRFSELIRFKFLRRTHVHS